MKYYVEGCGFKKVLNAKTVEDAFAKFTTSILCNTRIEDVPFSPLIIASERGFLNDLGPDDQLNDNTFISSYAAFKLGGHYIVAESLKPMVVEYFQKIREITD